MGESFENLKVWQKAHELMLFVHREVVPLLPKEEKWDLADQIRRSSKSAGANIAEGYGRFYYKDRVRFCYNARGSLTETQNHLIDARHLEYISPQIYAKGCGLAGEAQRLLNGYIDYLKRERPGKNEPGIDINVDQSHINLDDDDHPTLIPDPQSLIPHP
jgi:four helix bundle protein